MIVLGGEKSTVGGQTEDSDIVARFEMLPTTSLSDFEIIDKEANSSVFEQSSSKFE